MRLRTPSMMLLALLTPSGCVEPDDATDDVEYRDADTYIASNKTTHAVFRPNGCVDAPNGPGPWNPHQEQEYVLDELLDQIVQLVFGQWDATWGPNVCEQECTIHGWMGAESYSASALQYDVLEVRDLGFCPGPNGSRRIELMVEANGFLACQCHY